MKGLETRRGKGEKWKRKEWGGTKRERGISSTLNITSNTV